MRILLTGGCGFIGSAVIRHIIRDTNHSVLNVDCMTYAASEETVEDAAESGRYEFARANIVNGSELSRLFETFRPQAVMHLAAESHVDRSIDGPGVFIQTNVVGTYSLLEAARKYWLTLDQADR
ncbi:GDP-mannose 4,6-dehydratase, partial [Acetobacter sp. P1H12_c]